VLVGGPTGSGKTTTLAALVNEVNLRESRHIITIEDPIEYEHPHRRSLVEQIEIGIDAPDFPTALRAALRQAPDSIVVGEMRDPETMLDGGRI
jgi:twitching motility protein PilT